MGLDCKADLTARGDDDHLWISAWSIGEHVRSPRNARRVRILVPIESRQRLPRKREHRGLVAQLHDEAISLDHFVSIAWPQSDQSWNCAQRDQLLDRLVSGTVFAVAH